MREYKDIAYNEYCKLDMYLPDKENFSTFVYFHGGGMVGGVRADWKICGAMEGLVKNGYAFVSVEYRMYSETEETGVRFPDYLHDAAQAVAYVKKHLPALGGNGKIYVTGSSAGAWLSAMLCLNDEYLKAAGVENEEIDGWIIDSAQMTSHFNVLRFEKGLDPRLQRIDEFSPLYYVNADMKFSKMLLLFYEKDMACRAEQNRLFYQAVLHFNKDADIEYRFLAGGHCAGIYTKNENGELVYVQEILDWLKRKEG